MLVGNWLFESEREYRHLKVVHCTVSVGAFHPVLEAIKSYRNYRNMPRPGGEADKFGNRYEGVWTVDAALDVIEGEYVELVVEGIGDEDAGVEFYRTDSHNAREYHSIKRQHSRGNWTISLLTKRDTSNGRSILGDLLQKARLGYDGAFSSGTSATELEELIRHTTVSDSLEELEERLKGNPRLSAHFDDRITPICEGDAVMAHALLRRIRVRTKNEPELKNDVERRIRAMFRRGDGLPIDATAVRLLIGDFLLDRLGTFLTKDLFLSFLSERDIKSSRLAGDENVGNRMRVLNEAYIQEIDALLINRTEIEREESIIACRTLLGGNKSVMLEGQAGGGKSCTVAQIMRKLQNENVPSLVIRLDRLTERDISAQTIGTNRGLPESPVIALGEFAGDKPSVLCIDQLDALSLISARHQSAWGGCNEMLQEARGYSNMRILFVCRSFDLEHDPHLRDLVADSCQVERIQVGELDTDTVKRAITDAGITGSSLNYGQLRILSVPLHLYLFLEVAEHGELNFSSKGDLFDAYWNRKSFEVNARLPNQLQDWSQAIATLCEAMSIRENLIVPEYFVDECRSTIQAMASEGVVYTQDGYLRFFHETFFDYSFARTFLRSSKDLVQWLLSDDQDLFRRSQIRQVLEFLRSREPNKSLYLSTLRGLLENAGIRFHIKKLVLQWLGALSNPTSEEWTVVESVAGHLDGHAWQAISNSVPWFDILQEIGKWNLWLSTDDNQADLTIRLLSTPNVLSARSATIAELIGARKNESDEWRIRMSWLVEMGNDFTSPQMQDLVLNLIVDGTLDVAHHKIAMNSDWWSIWYGASAQKPEFTARVMGAWFDRQVTRAAQLGLDDPFDNRQDIVRYSHFSGEVIANCATAAPLQFVRELFPRFAALEERAPQAVISPPTNLGDPDDQLRTGLADSMISLAKTNPDILDSIVDGENYVDSKWMSSLLLRAWSANPEFYAERIVQFLLEDPEQRLTIEYSFSFGDGDAFLAISRTAVAACSSLCSDESLATLVGAIKGISQDWESRARLVGRTELALLSALPEARVSDAIRMRIQELRRRFPGVAERGMPAPIKRGQEAQWVGSPIPEEALPRMSDEQWLSAMSRYDEDRSTLRQGNFVGGAVELSRDLWRLASEEPSRFVALINRMDRTHSHTYFEAILSGLTADENGTGHPGTLEQVCAVLRRIRDLQVQTSGVSLAWAIGAIANETLPSDIVEMLCLIAQEDPDPESDTWQPSFDRGINSARGAATYALSRILFADAAQWATLKPTIERVVEDDALIVRQEAAGALLAILDTHRTDALALFARLTTEAEPILGTQQVGRFINFAMFRNYTAIRPLLLTMLESNNSESVRAGARFMVTSSLWMEEAIGDDCIVLAMGEEARIGAVQTYCEFLSHEGVGTDCEKHLVSLFQDESETVRREASRCWFNLEADEIALRGPLIAAFAQSIGSGNDARILCYRLQKTRLPIPVEVCELAERAVEIYGQRVTSYQFGEAGIAKDLFTLMIRLHQEHSDYQFRQRVLDIIDRMVRAGVLGSDEQLRRQFDRTELQG